MNLSKNDEWYTPRHAVEIIVPYIPKGSVIWCPFDKENSQYVKVLRGGYSVLHSHIDNGQDFFNYEPSEPYDCIISNPPFSKRDDVLERLFKIGKPFGMFLNMNGMFDSKRRFAMLKEREIQLLVPNGRTKFTNETHNELETKTPPFQCVYLCWKLLPKQICYEKDDLGLFGEQDADVRKFI